MTETTAVEKREEREAKLSERLLDIAGDSFELRAEAFRQLTAYKQAQIIKNATAAIASLSWGSALSLVMRSEVARYALELGTDPVRHWEVLGGTTLYDKAELWMDLVTAQPDFEGFTKKFMHADRRLTEEQSKEREALRAEHGVPDGAAGACLVVIHRTGKIPSEGVNWAGSYEVAKLAKTGQPGTHKDPIGDENPTKTAFTRAFRKAAKTAYPLWFRRNRKGDEDHTVELGRYTRGEVETRLEGERQERKAVESPVTHQLAPGVALSGGSKATYPPVEVDEDPYAPPLTDDEITQHDVPDDAA